MSETETTDPSRRRGPFAVVAGRAIDPERRNGAAQRQEAAALVSFDRIVSFDRKELRVLFDLYGAKVAAGEWRDYALDVSATRAVFSIYRRASEAPLYRIEKNPDLGRKQGAFSVIAASGLVMRRGHDLARVVAVLQKKLELVRD
jgi:hypothetical protein